MNEYGKPISYQISKRTFNAMLENRTDIEKKENPYAYVMRIINRDRGLRGVVKVLSVV